MRVLIAFCFFFIFQGQLFAAGRIAIFDYDARTPENPGVAPYLQHQLKLWKPDIEIKYLSAGGDGENAIKMLQDLDTQQWDLIVTITTDAMLLARHYLRKTPFVFTNVNNPKVFSIQDRGGTDRNFTGATYYVPVKKQLQLFLRIQPDIKKLGFIFDSTNRSMQAEARESRQACLDLGIGFRYRRIGKKEDLQEATKYLLDAGSDAIIATSSGKIYMNIEDITQIARSIPVYSFNSRGVSRGAVAALSTDYWDMIDELVMPRIKAILDKKKSIHELEIGYPSKHRIKINKKSLQYHGLNAPW
ncbi:ABC transporter substrate-binding protein [Motiliproteus sp. MSK22-1]|uniref:ABC transporter substrate-binding protein n=1 Tax=Motiliproteus sp. MSK22-1 TaxID=1897630 RepID=UPI0009754433|nr:ABC transporter substrate-binding protein [Motiliproteus sp. MSK22-1]OMH32617.1 hypothetical protein BGP75_13785 [Motiliproteus sp. MSK22-1]